PVRDWNASTVLQRWCMATASRVRRKSTLVNMASLPPAAWREHQVALAVTTDGRAPMQLADGAADCIRRTASRSGRSPASPSWASYGKRRELGRGRRQRSQADG